MSNRVNNSSNEDYLDDDTDVIGEQIEYHLNNCLDRKIEEVENFFQDMAERLIDETMRIGDASTDSERRDIESKLSAYIQVYVPAMGGAMVKLRRQRMELEKKLEGLSNQLEFGKFPSWLNDETMELN